MAALWGESGLGKTITVNLFRTSITERVAYVVAQVSPTVRATAIDLYAALTGEVIRGTRFEMDDLIREELRGELTPLVVVDEAHRFSCSEFDFLRSLHDDPSLRFSLIFVANPAAWNVIRNNNALEQRLQYRYRYPAMELKEALQLLPKFHDLYRDCAELTLTAVYNTTQRANLRFLKNFTRDAQRMVTRLKKPRLDEDVIEVTRLRMGSREADAEEATG